MFTFVSNNEADTARLASGLASTLPAGTVVALIGTLGAGKTRLVDALATALGTRPGTVTSPTFVLVNEYRGGRLPIYHFDTFRLKDDAEFLDLGPDEYFDADGLSFVEWADRVTPLLPAERLEITFEVTGETTRQITVQGTTPRMEGLVHHVALAASP